MLARQFVAEARRRILAPEEARCLALEAARGLPGWSVTGASVTVKPFGKPNTFDRSTQFTATRVSAAEPVESGRMLTVDLSNAIVRDDETGLAATSAGVGNLASKLVGLRTPPMLTDEDAASVALLVPRVAANLREGCRLEIGGAFYSDQALMGVSCAGNGIRDSNVLVNLRTGEVKDPSTGAPLESSAAARLAQNLLSQLPKRRADLEKEVASACR